MWWSWYPAIRAIILCWMLCGGILPRSCWRFCPLYPPLALPWHGARLLSLHGRRPQAAELHYEKDALLGILTDAVYTSHSVPLLLQAHGWPPAAKLFICARLSYEDEVICATTLGEAAAEREYTHCVLVVKA